MILKTIFLGLESGGKSIVIMNGDDAERLGVLSLGRVAIRFNGEVKTAIVHKSSKLADPGTIGVCKKVWSDLGLSEGSEVVVEAAPFPNSLYFIRNKLNGRKLGRDEM
ncbi:MAG: thymidine phosphorylase, partial [Methanothrix sp.]